MAIQTPFAINRPPRWDIWWRWLLAALLGIAVGLALEQALSRWVPYPGDDETAWIEHPWRLVPLACAYYLPLSLAQWLVLRRYVRQAWRWPLITLGSVVVGHPTSIYALWQLSRFFGRNGLERPAVFFEQLAFFVWFFGAGGILVNFVAEWLALRHWAANTGTWVIVWGATSLGWALALPLLGPLLVYSMESAAPELLLVLATAGLYQLMLAGAVATLLKPDRQPNDIPALPD